MFNKGEIVMSNVLTGIVLQGGGALGAYEYGALKRIYKRKDFKPKVITGVSIGAITAAVLAGPKNGDPIGSLGQLWDQLTVLGPSFMSSFGNPAMYTSNLNLLFNPFSATSIYDTSPLYRTLSKLVSLDTINNGDIRLVVTSSNITEGTLKEFDNKDKNFKYEHIVASGSLGPAFPMTQVDGNYYWDGGFLSNTPFRPAIHGLSELVDDNPDAELELIVIDLFPKTSSVPENMTMVQDRLVDLQFINHYSNDKSLFDKIASYSDLIKEIDKVLPNSKAATAIRNSEAYQSLIERKKIKKITIPQISEEKASGASDFSSSAIKRRIELGYEAASSVFDNESNVQQDLVSRKNQPAAVAHL